jgi:membrane protein YqaA with SNARE-associated domain
VDQLLMSMSILNIDGAFRYALIATLGSVLGGLIGFILGYGIFLTVGTGLMGLYGFDGFYERVMQGYSHYSVLVLLAAGFAPVPFNVFAILHGFLQGGVLPFLVAAVLARGCRYVTLAWLLWRGGPGMKEWIERRFYNIAVAVTLLVLLSVITLKYVVSYFGYMGG